MSPSGSASGDSRALARVESNGRNMRKSHHLAYRREAATRRALRCGWVAAIGATSIMAPAAIAQSCNFGGVGPDPIFCPNTDLTLFPELDAFSFVPVTYFCASRSLFQTTRSSQVVSTSRSRTRRTRSRSSVMSRSVQWAARADPPAPGSCAQYPRRKLATTFRTTLR